MHKITTIGDIDIEGGEPQNAVNDAGAVIAQTIHYNAINTKTGKTHGFELICINGEEPEAEHARFAAAVEDACRAVTEITAVDVSGLAPPRAVSAEPAPTPAPEADLLAGIA